MTTTMTLSEIAKFDQYCKNNHISKSKGFNRFNISEYLYYKSKRILSSSATNTSANKHKISHKQETNNNHKTISNPRTNNKQGIFIPLEPSESPSRPHPSAIYSHHGNQSNACSQHNSQSTETNLTIDVNMGNGKEIRISGSVTISVLHEVLISLSDNSSHV